MIDVCLMGSIFVCVDHDKRSILFVPEQFYYEQHDDEMQNYLYEYVNKIRLQKIFTFVL